MIRLLADVAGTLGMLLFLMAELRQFYKIKKTGKLTGLSFHAYLSKLIAVISTGICFALTALYVSLFVIILEGIVVLPILYWLWKYRKRSPISCMTIDGAMYDDEVFDFWDNEYDERWDKE